MKNLTVVKALAAVAIAVAVPYTFAQTGGQGSGMMGGYDGNGMGTGMMGGYGGNGMGPGMMGGYDGNGMGPGMMGGYGGYGMGPGMMGGYGGRGMGPAMMYGYGGAILGGLNLTDDQREKVTKIQEALATKHWELMGKLQQQQFALREQLASGKSEDAAIGKGYKNMEVLRQQMRDSGADAQKQMEAVLTKPQREQLQRGLSRGTH